MPALISWFDRLRKDQGQGRITGEDAESSLPACFERTAKIHFSRKAIVSGAWQPTYGELNHAANHLARALLERGGARGDRVAVLMRHDGPLIAAVLAVLKAGRVAVALNPTDPPARIAQMIAGAGADAVLADAANRERAAQIAGDPRRLLIFEEHFEKSPLPDPAMEISPDAVASISYTSGSTGHPKGVIGTHRSILHHVYRCSRAMEILPPDRIAPLSSFAGGQGMGMAWCALLNGAAVCPFPLIENGIADFWKWMVKRKVTILSAATSVFRQVMAAKESGMRIPALRLVRIGSEATTLDDFAAFRGGGSSNCVLMHAYSTTETGNVTQLRLGMDDAVAAGLLPVGRAVEGMEVLLLDEQRNEVVAGAIGEIVVRSRYLSPGYWGDAALTGKFFSPPAHPGDEGLYRTGDMGRLNAEGQLVVTGRKGDRINFRGHSLELSEIEHALLGQPEIEGAMVCVRTDARGEEMIACVVPQKPHAPDSTAVRESLRRTLPAHMIPQLIVIVDAFPLTPTGKPDRREMLARLEKMTVTTPVPPRTGMEARFEGIWSQCLGISPVGVYDNFFEKGGDSLRAVDLMLRLSIELERKLPMELLIKHPSIAQMIDKLESQCTETTPDERQPRSWQASLLTLRAGGDQPPLVIIPGGYTTENELLVFAGLLPYLDEEHPVFGVKLNFHAEQVESPPSLGSMAGRIAEQVLRQNFPAPPVLIGECQAAALALEVSRLLARSWEPPPELILLDPWQPAQSAGSGGPHPPAIEAYYHFSRTYEPAKHRGKIHILCPEDSRRLPACLDWWSARTQTMCHGLDVPGNHDTYIRMHRKSIAGAINALCGKKRR